MRNLKIRPEEVYDQTLMQKFSKLVKGEVAAREITDNVAAALYSRYPGRRKQAMQILRSVWGDGTRVGAVESEGVSYVYVKLGLLEINKWFLVNKYHTGCTVMEEVPSEEERRSWAFPKKKK